MTPTRTTQLTYKPTVIIDLDDTLVDTSRAYREAIGKAAASIATRTRVAPDRAAAVIETLNNALVSQAKPFNNEWFPSACGGAGAMIAALTGEDYEETLGQMAWTMELVAIGRAVYESAFPAVSGAADALGVLRRKGYQIVVYTKGEAWLQNRKVVKAGLGMLVDSTWVVGAKTVAALQGTLIEVNADFTRTWVVGDSRRDDIAPAIALRLPTVLVAYPGVPGNPSYDDAAPPELRHLGYPVATHTALDVGSVANFIPRVETGAEAALA